MVHKYLPLNPIDLPDRQWPSNIITKSPIWCSVDLRDGNQALPNPMNPAQKLEYFQLLCKIGFKQIEVGFPSASKDDFDFVRRLIEEHHIPEDVTIMVLTQCRANLIDETMKSLIGVRKACVHSYIATSELHMKHVFKISPEETIFRAVAATCQIRQLAEQMPESDIRHEFSPEEFTDTDVVFALKICTAVFEEWGQATIEKPMILNLPATVERRPPNQVADMFEYFIRNFPYRDQVLISTHAHNDQGMAVASTEMALLAGADRVEGTLFGHGERTGNTDISTVALNLFSRGINIGLDFFDLSKIVETVQRLTGMTVPSRQPYSGELVFTAFSGSHQDAIKKVINNGRQSWVVPYLILDPNDIGRKYEEIIRITSQSGKGGMAWIMENNFGIKLPSSFQPVFRKVMQNKIDSTGGEVSAEQLMKWFKEEFININSHSIYYLIGYWPNPDQEDPAVIHGRIKIIISQFDYEHEADGNGPVDAFVKALNGLGVNNFEVMEFYDDAITGTGGSDASAMAFVLLKFDSRSIWGVGQGSNIDQAAAQAIISALNRKSQL